MPAKVIGFSEAAIERYRAERAARIARKNGDPQKRRARLLQDERQARQRNQERAKFFAEFRRTSR